jgi:glycosyltransferase involved in cell wall biosynthesis/O-antigen/teichoic acid export membrane protein
MSTLPTRFRRNALANYFYTFVLLALALVVTPILFRGLGKNAYGTWVLVTSSVFYFDLLKFGFSRAAIKYVAESSARGDLDRVRRVIATSCAALALPGLLLLIAAPGLALLFPHIFDSALYRAHPDLKTAAVILVFLSVADMALAIPFDTFGSALMGFQRYDLLNATLAGTALAQASAWTVIIALGGGLVAIGVATITLSFVSQLVRYAMVRRLTGGFPLRRSNVDRSLVRPLMSMSSWIAVTDFSEMVINRIDPLVVGLVAGVPQAGIYAVGQKLASLAGRFTVPAVSMFFPHASELSAANDKRALREALLLGTRISLVIATPLTIVLGVLAKPAIVAWVGPSSANAADVVVFLSAAYLVVAVTQTGVFVLRGMGDVKMPARINLLEAGLNLGLSVTLGLWIGYKGVALGTFLAAVVTQLAILLPYICRQTETKLHWLLLQILRAHALPVAVSLSAGLALRSRGLSGLGPVVLAGAAIVGLYFLAAWMTSLTSDERRFVIDALRGRSRSDSGAGERNLAEPVALRPGPRVVLIDPSPRGGIALYTMQLARTLSDAGVRVETLSSRELRISEPQGVLSKRLLPFDRWGKPQHAGPGFYLKRALTWIRSARVIKRYVKRQRPDVVHFQAQINRRFDGRLVRKLARRAPIVWTAHDVLPFERSERDPEWFSSIYRAADAVVVHTNVAADEMREVSGVDADVIEHLTLGGERVIPQIEARRGLGLPESGRILAALGFIRPYKGYELLADVWERLGEKAPLLLVMGELLEERERPLIERLERTGRAHVRLGYASEEDLQLAISASDALLLPYKIASESGLLHLALSRGVPVIASDAPQLAAAVHDLSAGTVVPRSVEAWSAAVTGELPPPPPTPSPLSEVGARHRAVYERVIEARTPPLRPFRLVLYSDASSRGGAEQVLADLAKGLDPMIDVTVMGVDEEIVSWIAAHRKEAGICLVPPVRNKRDIRPILAHRRAIRKLRPEIFHANLRHPYSSQYALAAALTTRGVRVVAVEHLPMPASAALQRRLKRLTSRHLAAHVSVSKSSARTIEQLLDLPSESVRTIYNGIAAAPAPAPRLAEGTIVGAVGRFTEQKGFDLYLRALAQLPEVSGVLVGDGPNRPQIERLIDELGLRERVVLTGWRSDARELIGSFDLLVVPSRCEPFGLVAAEAMSAGVPVVAMKVDGLAEVVVDGETGYLVPPEDVGALVGAIRRALLPGEAARLGERAKVVAREAFGVERMVQDYESLYRRLLP